jgi:hypothetical protein
VAAGLLVAAEPCRPRPNGYDLACPSWAPKSKPYVPQPTGCKFRRDMPLRLVQGIELQAEAGEPTGAEFC